MKRKYFYDLLIGLGALLLAAGLFGIKLLGNAQGIWQVLPFLGVGIGSGLLGHGAGERISRHAAKKNPEAEYIKTIERNDERNIAVANRAKARAWDWMVFVFGAFILVLVLMNVDWIIVLLAVFVYLFIVGSTFYYWTRYNREM